ncbi:P-loop containing nucleoside triphosphate hydrolase protein [Auriculariales sp. MPI-PUGE-AT-0066]|nr:P-loop containing nucleoside triphosphate hydrolase protein [Auriculariales sp. MPI-PUGE-AT-0066]
MRQSPKKLHRITAPQRNARSSSLEIEEIAPPPRKLAGPARSLKTNVRHTPMSSIARRSCLATQVAPSKQVSKSGDSSKVEVIEFSASPPTRKRDLPSQNPHRPKAPLITSGVDCSKLLSHYPKISDFLRDLGYESLRKGQPEAIHAALGGYDVVVRLATGVGKTLAAVLPAYYRGNGLTVIIVPTRSLLVQYVSKLNVDFGLPTMSFQSEMPPAWKDLFIMNLRQEPVFGQASVAPLPYFLIINPEQLFGPDASHNLMDALQRLRNKGLLSRFVMDEAHTFLEWTFRNPLQRLTQLRTLFPGVPITALSATLTDVDVRSLMSKLNLRPDTKVITGLTDRPNITYNVIYSSSAEASSKLLRFVVRLQKEQAGSCIIYCVSPKECDTLISQLRNMKVTAAIYHSKMNAAELTQNANDWLSGRTQFIVATSSLGVGIDKRDVRYVLHYGPPLSFTEWAQQSGRAGRDGLPATNVVFYRLQSFENHAPLVWEESSGWDVVTHRSRFKQLCDVHMCCLAPQRCIRQSLQLSGTSFDCTSSASCAPCSSCRHQQRDYHAVVNLSVFASTAFNAIPANVGDGKTIRQLSETKKLWTATSLKVNETTVEITSSVARDLLNYLAVLSLFNISYHKTRHQQKGFFKILASGHDVSMLNEQLPKGLFSKGRR